MDVLRNFLRDGYDVKYESCILHHELYSSVSLSDICRSWKGFLYRLYGYVVFLLN